MGHLTVNSSLVGKDAAVFKPSRDTAIPVTLSGPGRMPCIKPEI